MKPYGAFTWIVAAVALGAIAAWPFFVARSTDAARASALPTAAPVTADYRTRDKLIAFWERAAGERHAGDMLSPRQLADQYLQRYRERGDIDDVLRAQRQARRSLAAQPIGNLQAQIELASIDLTLHRFHAALDRTMWIERWDQGDFAMFVREASLDMEVGNYSRAALRLATVPLRDRDDPWRVVKSRELELTGHLVTARTLLAEASAYQNANFDAPAQQRAWYLFRQGEMAFETGDNEAALRFERGALGIFPNYPDAYRVAARVECALHDWRACLNDAAASAAIVPYPETLGYEVDAERALGDAPAATRTDDLIRTIERIGNAQHISDRLLAVYYSEHRERAGDAYAIARRELRARDDVFTEDTLAWAAAMDDRWGEARVAIGKAVRLNTENALFRYHAAVIAQHFGDRASAERELTAALALNPRFHPFYADDARARLATLTART